MEEQKLIAYEHFLTYLYCSRKLYMEQQLGMATKRSHYELKKIIFNEALAYTNKFEEGIVKSIRGPMPYHRVFEKYKASHSRALQEAVLNNKEQLSEEGISIINTSKDIFKDMMRPTEMKARNTYEFMTKNHLYSNELWWELVPKMTYNLSLHYKGVQVLIDRVDNYPHSITPVLVKRQNPPEEGIWSNHRYELALAMVALAKNNAIVQEGIILYNGEERDLVLTTELEEKLNKIIERIRSILTNKELPKRVSIIKKCERCPHKEQCWDDIMMSTLQKTKSINTTY